VKRLEASAKMLTDKKFKLFLSEADVTHDMVNMTGARRLLTDVSSLDYGIEADSISDESIEARIRAVESNMLDQSVAFADLVVDVFYKYKEKHK
jgi:hypothetical protein